MSDISTPSTASSKMRNYRARLRAAGLRPIQIWVPDTKAPGFANEVRRQSLLLKNDPHEKEIMNWIEQNADTEGWE
jgi:hypothetical protein